MARPTGFLYRIDFLWCKQKIEHRISLQSWKNCIFLSSSAVYMWRCSMDIISISDMIFNRRRFHVKGPRKKVNIKKWVLVDEMCKIIRQFDDFGRFLGVLMFFCFLFCCIIQQLISNIMYAIPIVQILCFCLFVLSFAMF